MAGTASEDRTECGKRNQAEKELKRTAVRDDWGGGADSKILEQLKRRITGHSEASVEVPVKRKQYC